MAAVGEAWNGWPLRVSETANATSTTVAGLTAQTVTAIVAAVRSGALSLTRLLDAVGHILHAKGSNLCR